MLSISIAMISVFIPIIPMILFVVQVDKFANLADANKEIEFAGEFKLKTLFPKTMEHELNKSNIDKEVAQKIITQYTKVFNTLCFYLIFWILYIVYIIFKFITLIHSNTFLTPTQLGAHWGSWIMNIIVMWLLIINPICQMCGIMKKLVQTGYKFWGLLLNIQDKFIEKSVKWFEKGTVLLFSFTMIYFLTMCWYRILTLIEVPIVFYTIIPALLLYQYIIIKFASKYISIMLKKIFKKRKIHEVIVREIIQNSTYICLVFIYGMSYYLNKSDSQFIIAINILFLIDTYIKQGENIDEKRINEEKISNTKN